MSEDRPLFTVVVATLLRLTYPPMVMSIRQQTFHDFELHARHEPDVNEYVSRNRAAKEALGEYLVFTDDDCEMPQGYLATAAKAIEEGDRPVALGGPLQGNMFGSGDVLLSQPQWGVGANMIIRADAFGEMGGFEEDWGLGYPCKGWRADTDMWWRIEDRYPGNPLWIADMVIRHPQQMGSTFQPDVEDKFFQRWRERTISRFAPVDPRLTQFLLETQDLTPEEKAEVLRCRREQRKTHGSALPVTRQETEAEAPPKVGEVVPL